MDILPADYRKVTDNLQIGGIRKVPHLECSQSPCMRIENTVEGFKYYCFKCGTYHFESNFNSPMERMKRELILAEQTKRMADKNYSLPADFSHEIPTKGLAWLGMGGWTTEMIDKYNVGFSETMNRVILPVVYDGIHKGFTGRSVHTWLKPKYLEYCQDDAMWESLWTADDTTVCVICEDILSAGRCGEFVKAFSLLGTTISTAQLSALSVYKQIFLWLDDDKGGHTGVMKSIGRLRMLSEVQTIRSAVDPKLLNDLKIKEYLTWTSNTK